jgi:hypothetical protein
MIGKYHDFEQIVTEEVVLGRVAVI